MGDIFQVLTVGGLLAFVVWSLPVYMVRWAIFSSFWAGELRLRRMRRNAPERMRAALLQWELQHRREWTANIPPQEIDQRGRALTDDEMQTRHNELAVLITQTLFRRAVIYFTECTACQTFATGLVFGVLAGLPVIHAVCTALAYAAPFAHDALPAGLQKVLSAAGTTGCKTCGK